MNTNKIDLIKAEVVKLKSSLIYGACSSQIAMETMCKEEAYNEVLAILDTMQEEPVSDDLGDYINELSKQFPEVSFAKLSRIAVRVAKWQQEKDLILPKVWNRENLDDYSYQTAYDLSNDWAKETPTWHDVEMACKLGANWQKKQMMAKAIDGKVIANGMGNPILHLWDKGRHFIGKKVKVIVIDEC